MRGCVIGGGPSGIFVSKYLADKGIKVDIFEKQSKLLGNYNFAKNKTDIVRTIEANPRIKVYLNCDHSAINDKDYDFYVVATGGIPRELEINGKDNVIKSLDIIKQIYEFNARNLQPEPNNTKNSLSSLEIPTNLIQKFKDKKVLIIGLGNVSLDLISYIGKYIKEIVVLSRNSLLNAPFDNYLLRDIIDSNMFRISTNYCPLIEPSDRKSGRRVNMIKKVFFEKNCVSLLKDAIINLLKPRPTLKLFFGTDLTDLNNNVATYSIGNNIFRESFDSAISSIGFIPNKIQLDTKKPVYYLGWCETPRGNLGTSMVDAKALASKISDDFEKSQPN